MSLSEPTNFATMQGSVTLNGAATVVVNNVNVRAISQILLTIRTAGGTPLGAFVKAIVPGTSFSVSGLAGDTSIYNWIILNYPLP